MNNYPDDFSGNDPFVTGDDGFDEWKNEFYKVFESISEFDVTIDDDFLSEWFVDGHSIIQSAESINDLLEDGNESIIDFYNSEIEG